MGVSGITSVKKKSWIIVTLFFGLVIFLLLFHLDQFPSLWWDEGWTLSVARNWVEHGIFGHYLDGAVIPPRIPVRFTEVIPIALSFKLFGVGVWQGRLPSVIFTLLTLVFLYYLASKLYNYQVANGTLFVGLCMSVYVYNPVFYGRQALGEMPMLFYLLGGYTFLWLALTRSFHWIWLAGLFWGISLLSKLQVPPFWLASITLMLFVVFVRKEWRKGKIILSGVISTLLIAFLLMEIQNRVIPSILEDQPLVVLLFNSVIFVFAWPVRLLAIENGLIYGLPAVLGFIFEGRKIISLLLASKIRPGTSKDSPNFSVTGELSSKSDTKATREIVQFGYWGLGVSWFAWYLFLGMCWPRYLFPAYFIGTLFLSAFLQSATHNFDWRATIQNASLILLRKQINKINLQALLAVLLIGVFISLSLILLYQPIAETKTNPIAVTDYIANKIPSNALIETFESELFFLAPHLYHFPSDFISMQLVRKVVIDPTLRIDYDPLQANPDYLIVGGYNNTWGLYDSVIASGAFKLEKELPGYQIYRRVRDYKEGALQDYP